MGSTFHFRGRQVCWQIRFLEEVAEQAMCEAKAQVSYRILEVSKKGKFRQNRNFPFVGGSQNMQQIEFFGCVKTSCETETRYSLMFQMVAPR